MDSWNKERNATAEAKRIAWSEIHVVKPRAVS